MTDTALTPAKTIPPTIPTLVIILGMVVLLFGYFGAWFITFGVQLSRGEYTVAALACGMYALGLISRKMLKRDSFSPTRYFAMSALNLTCLGFVGFSLANFILFGAPVFVAPVAHAFSVYLKRFKPNEEPEAVAMQNMRPWRNR